MDNTKYVQVDVIYQRLTQRIKKCQIDFYDVAEWCTDCMINEIGYSKDMYEYRDVLLTISDYQAAVPTNCFRIECVKRNDRIVNYINNGAYLNFEYNYTNVYIDYWAIPTDADTGLPVVPRGYEDACMWYCLKSLNLEDYLEGTMDQNRWNTINTELEVAKAKALANSSKLDRNTRIKMLRAMHTIYFNFEDVSAR